MDISTIFTFTIATALIVAIPGPSILMIVAAGVAGGRRAALGALFAILAADVIFIALVASGFGALAELGGATLDWLTTIGGLILVLLGLRMLRDDRKGVPSRVSAHAHSLGSFIATITNPKSLLFFAAFLPQFVDPSSPAVPQYLMLAALFFLAATPVGLAYALGSEWLTNRDGPLGRISALAPRLAGLCLIALGATSMARLFW
ncbi:MAG: LysE family translocator [Proteobacteria bacterium]|nr:LysE family translocator [Pseudomonadota bacterium]